MLINVATRLMIRVASVGESNAYAWYDTKRLVQLQAICWPFWPLRLPAHLVVRGEALGRLERQKEGPACHCLMTRSVFSIIGVHWGSCLNPAVSDRVYSEKVTRIETRKIAEAYPQP
jgi:hypothetical protein